MEGATWSAWPSVQAWWTDPPRQSLEKGCGVQRQVHWSLSRAVSGVVTTVRGAEDQVVVEEMGGEMLITWGVSALTGSGVTLAGVSAWP